MSEIDFAGEALALKEKLEDHGDFDSLIADCALIHIESALRSIAQRAWQEKAKDFTFNWDRNVAEIRADERAKLTATVPLDDKYIADVSASAVGQAIREDERRKWADIFHEEAKNSRRDFPAHPDSWIAFLHVAKRLRENSDG